MESQKRGTCLPTVAATLPVGSLLKLQQGQCAATGPSNALALSDPPTASTPILEFCGGSGGFSAAPDWSSVYTSSTVYSLVEMNNPVPSITMKNCDLPSIVPPAMHPAPVQSDVVVHSDAASIVTRDVGSMNFTAPSAGTFPLASGVSATHETKLAPPVSSLQNSRHCCALPSIPRITADDVLPTASFLESKVHLSTTGQHKFITVPRHTCSAQARTFKDVVSTRPLHLPAYLCGRKTWVCAAAALLHVLCLCSSSEANSARPKEGLTVSGGSFPLSPGLHSGNSHSTQQTQLHSEEAQLPIDTDVSTAGPYEREAGDCEPGGSICGLRRLILRAMEKRIRKRSDSYHIEILIPRPPARGVLRKEKSGGPTHDKHIRFVEGGEVVYPGVSDPPDSQSGKPASQKRRNRPHRFLIKESEEDLEDGEETLDY